MPWNYQITRRMFPGEVEPRVSLREWAEVVEADPSMSLAPSEYQRPSAEQMSAGVWHGHPTDGPIQFEWVSGNISVERPDQPTLRKLHDLARVLRAHVEDDDGGWYDRRGHFLGHLAAG